MNKLIETKEPFVWTLLERYNPFGLSMIQFNRAYSMVFGDQTEAYLYVMTKTRTFAPRGYIEMPLLMMQFYPHISFQTSEKLLETIKTWELSDIMLIENWGSKQAKYFFTQLCSALCAIAETSYNSANLDAAWDLFMQRLEYEKAKIELEKEKSFKCINENGNQV